MALKAQLATLKHERQQLQQYKNAQAAERKQLASELQRCKTKLQAGDELIASIRSLVQKKEPDPY